MVLALGELGFLSAQDVRRWTEKLLEAAGIEWQNVEASSSVDLRLEVDETGGPTDSR